MLQHTPLSSKFRERAYLHATPTTNFVNIRLCLRNFEKGLTSMPRQPHTIAMIPNCDSMVGPPKYIHLRQRYPTPELMFTQSASTARYQIHGWKLAWPYLEHCRLNTSARSSVVKCKGRAYRHIVHVFNRLSTDTGASWAQAFPSKTALCPGSHCIAFFPTILYLTRFCYGGKAWESNHLELNP